MVPRCFTRHSVIGRARRFQYNPTAEMLRDFGAAAALLVVCVTSCSSGTSSQPAKTPSKDDPRVWHQVGSWSGRGSQQLDTFPIERLTWRVRWETRNETAPGTGRLFVTANSGDSGRVIFDVLDVKGAGKDIEYFTELPRRYYFVVTSSNIEWTLIAEEPLE